MDSIRPTRIEFEDNKTIISSTNIKSFHRTFDHRSDIFYILSHRDNVTDDQSKILQNLYATIDYSGKMTISNGSGFDKEDGYSILPENLYHTTVDIQYRDPTEEEKNLYKGSFSDYPKEVFEIELPPLEEFENPVESDYLSLSIDIPYDDILEMARDFQRRIEFSKWINTKTSYIGKNTNLPPELDYTLDMNDRDQIKTRSMTQYDTLNKSFKNIFSVDYDEFFCCRSNVNKLVDGNKVKPSELVALDLVDESEDEDYCQYCAGIDSEDSFLYIEDKLDREKRVCESCAERWNDFEDDVVNRAKDEKAKQNGGQRRFHSEYN